MQECVYEKPVHGTWEELMHRLIEAHSVTNPCSKALLMKPLIMWRDRLLHAKVKGNAYGMPTLYKGM